MQIRFTGLSPDIDGDYELDETSFTMEERHSTIKRLTGLRGAEMAEAFSAGDAALLVAFACVALDRAGKAYSEHTLWQAKRGQILCVFPEDDAVVPPADELPVTELEPNATSGETSNGSSEDQTNDLSPTGSPVSATGATSGQEISES